MSARAARVQESTSQRSDRVKAVILCIIGLLGSKSHAADPFFEGHVRLPSGAPVSGAQVLLFDLTDLRAAPLAATTDPSGRFTLPLAGLAGVLPERFELGANYPNPFNPSTMIPYQLPAAMHVRLEVFNLLGQRVATLVDGEKPAGFHTASWDATGKDGQAVGAGVYLYRLTGDGVQATRSMLLIDGQAAISSARGGSTARGAAADGGRDGERAPAYGLTVSGPGLVPYVDPAFRVEAGMGPLDLVVEAPGSDPSAKVASSGGILGDVDNTGGLDFFDALLVALYSQDSSIVMPNDGDISLGDVDADGQVDLSDAWHIAVYLNDPSDPGLPAGIGEPVDPSASLSPDPSTVTFADDGAWHRFTVAAGEPVEVVVNPEGTTPRLEITTRSGRGNYCPGEADDDVSRQDGQTVYLSGCAEGEATVVLRRQSDGTVLRSYTFEVTGIPADLVVQSVSVSDSTLTPGQSFTLRATVRNQGTDQSAATTLRYYRSSNRTISTRDTQVGTDAVGALTASGTSAESISLTAPSAEGTYYYGACVESLPSERGGNNCSRAVRVTVTPSLASQTWKLYWTDRDAGRIQRSNLDGSGVEDFVAGVEWLESPVGLALDVSGGKLYWTDGGADKIQRSNLDGSVVEDLVTGVEWPWGLALDVSGGKMYWTDAGAKRIQRSNLDGSGVQDLVTDLATPHIFAIGPSGQPEFHGAGVQIPGGIALDVSGDKMYWTSRGQPLGKIRRSNLDGSGVEDLVTSATHLDGPVDLALDVSGGKMYWTSRGRPTGKIQRSNLDGSGVEDLVTTGLDDPAGLALDVSGGKMYWTDRGEKKIQRSNLDGSEVKDLVTTGLQDPRGIALGIMAVEVGKDLAVIRAWVTENRLMPGQSFQLAVRVRNRGIEQALTVRCYRSEDATIDATDEQVRTFPGVSGRVRAYLINLTAPTSTGTYYYGVCIDSVAGESNTGNNCSAGVSVTSILADLVLESVSVSDSTLTPGQSFTLSATVRNQGLAGAEAASLLFYRSSDRTISTRDTHVGTGAVSALAAAGTHPESIGLTAPSTEGTYYYGACVESLPGEWEGNNCSPGVGVRIEEPDTTPVNIPDANLRAVIEDSLRKARGETITAAEVATLDRFEIQIEGIRDLTGLEYATNLRELKLQFDYISDLWPLSGLNNLTRLQLWGKVSDLSPLSGLNNLTWLTVLHNNILDLSSLPPLSSLLWLNLLGNEISDVSPLSGQTNLRILELRDNNISDLFPLSGLYNLESLDLQDNNVSDLSPLSGLKNLDHLNLRDNEISDLSPLSGLFNLQSLRLEGNNVTDVSPLSGLRFLRNLSLRNNRIADLSPLVANSGLAQGDVVEVRGNPLSRSSYREDIPALQGRGVEVIFDPDPEILVDYDAPTIVAQHDDRVVVMGVPGRLKTDPIDFEALAQVFFTHYEDAFDYLMVLSNLDSFGDNQHYTYYGTHLSVQNAVDGTGKSRYSRTQAFGSAGKLNAILHFPWNEAFLQGPSLHEIMHSWANYTIPTVAAGHWGFSSANGQLGGFDRAHLVDHGGGRYSAGSFGLVANGGNSIPYSPIELYFAGLIPPSKVPDLWVAEDGKGLRDGSGDLVRDDSGYPIFTASKVSTWSIERIVAEHGARIPDSSQSQKEFRAALILAVDPLHPPRQRTLSRLSEEVRILTHAGRVTQVGSNFWEATDGRATLTMDGLSAYRRPGGAGKRAVSYRVVEPKADRVGSVGCIQMDDVAWPGQWMEAPPDNANR